MPLFQPYRPIKARSGRNGQPKGIFKNISENTFAEAYRDRLDPNPNDPGAYNFDANGQLRANITPNFWSDSDFNYVDTAGEPSPSRQFRDR